MAETPRRSTRRSSLKFAGLLALAATLALVARSSGFQPYRVLGSSMLPVLRPGDYVGINRAAFGFRLPGFRREARMPARGDLVVFRNPVRDSGPPELLKRVIGLPGDQIRTFGAQVFVNEWRVPTCFAGTYVYLGSEGHVAGRIFVEFLADRAYLTLVEPVEGTPFGPYLVKPGEAFVLGDHRSTSTDSRAWTDRFGRPGRGIAMRLISGRADWLLARAHRDGSHDFSDALAPLGIVPEADGIDVSRLRAGIEQCLAKPPAETHPPAQAAAAGLGHSGAPE